MFMDVIFFVTKKILVWSSLLKFVASNIVTVRLGGGPQTSYNRVDKHVATMGVNRERLKVSGCTSAILDILHSELNLWSSIEH